MVAVETFHRPEPVVVHIPLPEGQSRLTIFFRIVLLIPHGIFLYLYSLVAAVAALLGWVGALVLGRLPGPIYRFLCTWARTTAQVWAYASLLTGRYPPFVARDGYPADLECQATSLNRLAVLFRIFLALPAALAATFLTYGWALIALVFWVAALVKGRLPDNMHQATAATYRYYMRYATYAWMLTPTYARGLMGDEAPASVVVDGVAAPSPVPEQRGLLRLTRGAKRWVVAFMVVGVLGYVGMFAIAIASGGDLQDLQARVQVEQAYELFADDVATLQDDMGACGDDFDCVQREMGELSDGIAQFSDRVAAIDFPPDAEDEAAAMLAAAAEFRDAARQFATVASPDEYLALDERVDIGALGTRFDEAYMALVGALD